MSISNSDSPDTQNGDLGTDDDALPAGSSADKAAVNLGKDVLSSSAQWLVSALLIGLIFPLVDWTVVFSAVIVFTIAIYVMTRILGARLIVIALTVPILATTCSIIALSLQPGKKYVVPTDDILSASFVAQASGARGPFQIVPTYAPVPVKRWILLAISYFNDDFVFLESSYINGRYIAQSPSEVAASAIHRKPPNALGFISFPTFVERPVIRLEPKSTTSSELELSYGWSTIGPSFLSNVGPGSSGLFGVLSPTPLTIEDWRSLAYSEELIGGMASEPLPTLFQSLRNESVRTGSWNDLMRELTFRLAMMSGRYGSVVDQGTSLNMYELALVGNLRFVAEKFNERMPDRNLYDNAWLTPFTVELLNTINNLPIRPLQAQDDGGIRETVWLVATLRKITDLQRENSLVTDIDVADSDTVAEINERRISGMFTSMLSNDPDVATVVQQYDQMSEAFGTALEKQNDRNVFGEDMQVQAFIDKGESLTRRELLDWVRNGTDDVAWRVSQAQSIRGEQFGKKVAALMAYGRRGLSEPSTRPEFIRRYNDLITELSSVRAEYGQARTYVVDPEQRRILDTEFALITEITKLIDSLQQLNECYDNNAQSYVDCSEGAILERFMEWYPAPVRQVIRSMMSMQEARRLPISIPDYREPYGLEELGYVATLTLLISSDEISIEDALAVCSDTRARAGDLLREGRLEERAAVASVQLETLARCGAPETNQLRLAFRQRQIPLASWQGDLANMPMWAMLQPLNRLRRSN